jgi:hypothetical protein
MPAYLVVEYIITELHHVSMPRQLSNGGGCCAGSQPGGNQRENDQASSCWHFSFLVCPKLTRNSCRVTGLTCSDAKAQCRQFRKRAFPGKTNNPCSNHFRRCMAEGRHVSRNCNVTMEKR